MLKNLRPALVLLLIMTALTGLAYPLAVTGLAQSVFPWQARGSLIEKDGQIVGSTLIGQTFSSPAYFWGRPSATTAPNPADATKSIAAPYNAANSSGSNLAPSAKVLIDATAAAIDAQRAANPDQHGPLPSDLVSTSASGLDPHISPAAALWQIKRVAANRHAPYDEVQKLVSAHTQGREFGILGEARVNVLTLNMALDEQWPIK